jgi:dihydroorotase
MGRRPGLILKNVAIPGGRAADISIQDGLVVHTGSSSPCEETIDCTDLFVLPAAVDMHVHMRGGSQSAKEDWTTGSRSALAGGVTVVVDQPNTVPPLVSPALFRKRVSEARTSSQVHFAINSAVTPGTPLEKMWRAGAMAFGESFFAPSSYGDALDNHALAKSLRRIASMGALATIHAENVKPGMDADLTSHDSLRSPQGELDAVHAVSRCNTAHCHLHFCHLSTATAIDAAPGSIEVTPHHLFLSREKFSNTDTFAKVNPPLRHEHERKLLWSRWDTIDVIASDHAPHTIIEKHTSFESAPSGIPGVETMVPLLLAEVLNRRVSLDDVIRKTSITPATLLGIPVAGFSPGNRADFSLFPKEITHINPDTLHSKCGWTPFAGHPAVFPTKTIMDGGIIYDNGDFFMSSPSWIPGKGFHGELQHKVP